MSETKEDLALAVGAKKLHEARKSSFDKVQSYMKSFIEPSTGMLKASMVEVRPCPVCSSFDPDQMFVKNGAWYNRCKECSMCFVSPVFTDKALGEYYMNSTDAQAEITLNESSFYREIYLKGLKHIKDSIKVGKILDVGCSTGFFLDICKEEHFESYGIELNKKEATIAISKGHKVSLEMLEHYSEDIKFDAITLWDVFEHIKDGNKFLQQVKKRIAKNGIVFMQIPNSGSFAARVMQEKCNMFDGVEHCNLYNKDTIKEIANRNGFEVEKMSTVISEIPVLNNYLHYRHPYYGDFPKQDNILGIVDQDLLHKNLLGYKLQVVLRQKN